MKHAAAALSFFAAAAQAQPLRLVDAYHMALQGHPSVQQRRSGISASEQDLKAAQWGRFPTVTGENTRQAGTPNPVITNSSASGATWRVQQPLWAGGRIDSVIDAAALRQRIAEFSLEETEQDLLSRVTQSFSDYLRLRERVSIATDNLAEHQRLHDLIKRRLEQQVISEVDVALAYARTQQARTELMTLQATLQNARWSLEQLTGSRIDGELQAPQTPALSWADAESAYAAARSYSPTLRRLEAEAALARADAAYRRSALYPQVSARYEKFSGQAMVIPSDRWMLVLEYQPGSGLSSYSTAEAALKRADAAGSALEAGTRDLAEKVYGVSSEARAFVDQFAPANTYAEAAGTVMSSYLRQYTAGRKSWLEVLNAQRELSLARAAAADVAAGVLVAVTKLDILTGKLNRESVFATRAGAAR